MFHLNPYYLLTVNLGDVQVATSIDSALLPSETAVTTPGAESASTDEADHG